MVLKKCLKQKNKLMRKTSVFFLVPYPKDKAPSQRFRFEQYFKVLDQNNVKFIVRAFYSPKTWVILHLEGHVPRKIYRILFSFFVRWIHVFHALLYDVVFIHREVAPIGPPFFEFILAKVFRKKIIYDFDDAIWLPNYSEANTNYHKYKNYKKVDKIIKWATVISAGNDYLADYAKINNTNVVVNPTTIDTETYHNPSLHKVQPSDKLVIGWTGTHTTCKYLEFLVPVLEKLKNEFDFEFCVISNQAPDFEIPNVNFIKWNKSTEVQDLMRFNIGVMPLHNDKWAKGKCGFKALQYLSLGIPAIVSPIGVNVNIVDEGKNGFLCETADQWYNALYYLMSDQNHRDEMKKAAIQKVYDEFSVKSNQKKFLSLILKKWN